MIAAMRGHAALAADLRRYGATKRSPGARQLGVRFRSGADNRVGGR
jgi:hypothetical protein